MRENQNIAQNSVCSEKTHCRFSFPHRLHSTDSKFQSFLSPNLPNNIGDIWKILIQNGCRFITHSPKYYLSLNLRKFKLNKTFFSAYIMKISQSFQGFRVLDSNGRTFSWYRGLSSLAVCWQWYLKKQSCRTRRHVGPSKT